jgi:hypothetical protein
MEMDLYFAYLSEAEEAKKAVQQTSQPWQCEVTTFPPADAGTAPEQAVPNQVAPMTAAPAKPRFVCDEPE